MNALRTIAGELAGLFVEDRLFALAIALWLAIAGGAIALGIGPPSGRGAIFFVGLALVLIGSVLRAARRAQS